MSRGDGGCVLCLHPQAAQIDAELLADRISIEQLADLFGLTCDRSTISRHMRVHLGHTRARGRFNPNRPRPAMKDIRACYDPSPAAGRQSGHLNCPGYPHFCVDCRYGDHRCCTFMCRHREYRCSNAGDCPCAQSELRGSHWDKELQAYLVRRQRHEEACRQDRQRRHDWLRSQAGWVWPWNSGAGATVLIPEGMSLPGGPLEENG